MAGFNVHVIKCSGPPTSAPTLEGQHWIDTLNRVTYISVGTASVEDWICEDARTVKLMGCDAGVAVDDLVYQSTTANNTAVTATDNTNISPVIGQVISKPSATTCLVQLKGIVEVTVGRGRVFLSNTGTYTNTAPTSDYVQVLGWSCGDGRVELNPELRRVKRNNT